MEWSDNIKISDSHPRDYLPFYLDRLSNSEKDLMYYWHALPLNWQELDFNSFLIERRKLIAKVVSDAYYKISE